MAKLALHGQEVEEVHPCSLSAEGQGRQASHCNLHLPHAAAVPPVQRQWGPTAPGVWPGPPTAGPRGRRSARQAREHSLTQASAHRAAGVSSRRPCGAPCRCPPTAARSRILAGRAVRPGACWQLAPTADRALSASAAAVWPQHRVRAVFGMGPERRRPP